MPAVRAHGLNEVSAETQRSHATQTSPDEQRMFTEYDKSVD